MSKLIFVSLMLVLLGCEKSKESATVSESEFLPAKGWVLIEDGHLEDIRAAITDYESIARAEVEGTFRVELHEQQDGAVAVLFPDGLPGYDIANMTVWLSAPPNQSQVYGARSWVSSPDGDNHYYLKPEAENRWGDTLIGASKSGASIRIYVPETGISEISQPVKYEPEPPVSRSSEPVRFSITLETDYSWANPMLVVNQPVDYDWVD